jgi:hypothetical protein
VEINYIPIPIKKFISGQQAPVDLHLHIGGDKYIKVVNKGDVYDKNRILNYENHKASHLHLTDPDFSTYINYCFSFVEKTFATKKHTDAHDIYTICRIGELIFAELLNKGLTEDSAQKIDKYSTFVDGMLRGGPMMGRLSVELMNVDEKFAQRGLSMSFVTLLLLQGMKWKSEANIKFLFFCSLIADIALFKNPELINKPFVDMDAKEKEIYLGHPTQGAEIVSVSGIPQAARMSEIILHHHELPDGTGFPSQRNMQEIHPMALPVMMSDRIVHLLYDVNSPLKEKNFSSAFKYLYIRERQFFPTVYWDGLNHWQKIY